MSKFAIVILYEGLKPSESTIKALHTALCESRVVYDLEKVEMYKMSEEEIMAAIIAKPANLNGILFKKDPKEEEITPEAEAVLIIANNFEKAIAKGDMVQLFCEMCREAAISKYRQPNQPLDRAITLLASPDIIDHLAFNDEKDVKLWTDILNVVRRVYNSVYNV